MTEMHWRQAIAATHPDHGGELERFLAVMAARERWQLTHGICANPKCGRTFKKRHAGEQYCRQACWMKVLVHRRSRSIPVVSGTRRRW